MYLMGRLGSVLMQPLVQVYIKLRNPLAPCSWAQLGWCKHRRFNIGLCSTKHGDICLQTGRGLGNVSPSHHV